MKKERQRFIPRNKPGIPSFEYWLFLVEYWISLSRAIPVRCLLISGSAGKGLQTSREGRKFRPDTAGRAGLPVRG